MAYEVLARKWRPATFATMVGQEHVLKALIHALEEDRLHHAYLFTGTRGVGKTTVARILARCLNCERGVGPEPCGECSSCMEISEGRFVDLIEVDAASRTRVEDTRELLDNVQYAPTRGRFKVYLIDEVHMLSTSSFNALLKTLEEPPPHVKFLLATTDPKKLPVTVLSRCLQFHLKNLTPERIVGHLEHVLGAEEVAFEAPALWALARAADGSMRDALSLTDQAIAHGGGRLVGEDVARMLGTIDQGALERILVALADQDGPALLACVTDLAEHAADFTAVLGDLMSVLHQVAVAQAIPDAAPRADVDALVATVADAAQRLSPEDVQLFYQIALTGVRDLTWAPDARTGFEMTLLRMLAFRPEQPGGGERATASAPAATAAAAATATPSSATSSAPAADDARVEARQSARSAVGGAGPREVGRIDGLASEAAAGARVAAGRPAEAPVEPAPAGARPPATVTTLRPVPRAPVEAAGERPAAPEAAPASAAEPAPERGVSDAAAPGDASAEAGPASDAPASDEAPADPPPAAQGPARLDSADDWHLLLPTLTLRGLTGELAAHCLPATIGDGSLHLILDAGAESLLADVHVERLEAALAAAFGRPWRVRIEAGVPAGETPARRAERERAARQQRAEASIEADPLVRSLIETFGASVQQGSIRPLD
ncbi:MAG TPA: DNA polymerase III subunit gamma/tau [Pseudomonadales bacterium]|nr:DNA polymerase III subunit gamma/tau [Pseudomonadales bacterium]